jgi:glycosyltransferase involved in cell wall biosynthesis
MTAPQPKLLYLVTEDWYFWSHRLPMAQAAQRAGFAVGVATRVAEHGERIRGEGFALHPLRWRRGSTGLLANLAAILEIARLYRRERPRLVHHVALKPAVLGSIAAWLTGVPAVVNAVTGFGFVAASPSLRARLLRRPVGFALAHLIERANSRVIVQNADDRDLLIALNRAAAGRIAVIRGSGIDLAQFAAAAPPPAAPVVAGFAGRLLADKGIATLVEAQQLLRRRGLDLRLLVAGTPDRENPSSIPDATLARWRESPGITWLGQVADIRTLWRAVHIAVLPSRREGLPKSLLEAAAMARPLVATDVPGCREIARDGENALLVAPDDAGALARALERLAGDAALRERFGKASRALVESDLAADAVGAATVALYRALIDETGPGKTSSMRPSSR